MSKAIVGTRIRRKRRALGLTQVELARRIGISASYLNLIEHNKRGIAGTLLRRTAETLDMPLEQLDGAAERQLFDLLQEVGHAPGFAAIGVETANAAEFIARYPGWARALAALARSEHEASTAARALADRLTHDPFLGESVHRMLTRVAAIRSASEILTDFKDLEPERQERFHEIIHEESRSLTEVGEALAAYFDKSDKTSRTLTPLDEVEALFRARENRFEEIEEAVQSMEEAQSPEGAESRPLDGEEARALARERMGQVIEEIIASQPEIETSQAQARAREALLTYAAGAIQAPLAVFEQKARERAFDLEALAEDFSIPTETVCQRLTALPRGPEMPSFGYFRANAAGTIIEMRAIPGLVAPRYASACPLWALYRAQQSPDQVLRQRVLFPSGARFVFVALARSTGSSGFGRPRHYLTDMLAMSEEDAALTIYAPDNSVPVEEVGQTCRICPRRNCEHRVEDPLAG